MNSYRLIIISTTIVLLGFNLKLSSSEGSNTTNDSSDNNSTKLDRISDGKYDESRRLYYRPRPVIFVGGPRRGYGGGIGTVGGAIIGGIFLAFILGSCLAVYFVVRNRRRMYENGGQFQQVRQVRRVVRENPSPEREPSPTPERDSPPITVTQQTRSPVVTKPSSDPGITVTQMTRSNPSVTKPTSDPEVAAIQLTRSNPAVTKPASDSEISKVPPLTTV